MEVQITNHLARLIEVLQSPNLSFEDLSAFLSLPKEERGEVYLTILTFPTPILVEAQEASKERSKFELRVQHAKSKKVWVLGHTEYQKASRWTVAPSTDMSFIPKLLAIDKEKAGSVYLSANQFVFESAINVVLLQDSLGVSAHYLHHVSILHWALRKGEGSLQHELLRRLPQLTHLELGVPLEKSFTFLQLCEDLFSSLARDKRFIPRSDPCCSGVLCRCARPEKRPELMSRLSFRFSIYGSAVNCACKQFPELKGLPQAEAVDMFNVRVKETLLVMWNTELPWQQVKWDRSLWKTGRQF